MRAKRIDLGRWVHTGRGSYRTRCGRGSVAMVGPGDWAAHVGPPGGGRHVGNAHTASRAAIFAELALDEEDGRGKPGAA